MRMRFTCSKERACTHTRWRGAALELTRHLDFVGTPRGAISSNRGEDETTMRRRLPPFDPSSLAEFRFSSMRARVRRARDKAGANA